MAKTQQQDRVIRLPRELVEQVQAIAKAHDRSLAGELRTALRQYVARHARLLKQEHEEES
ncbi:MAG: Arc family DNA-binding protein [Solirubrobacteraceae bacterium]